MVYFNTQSSRAQDFNSSPPQAMTREMIDDENWVLGTQGTPTSPNQPHPNAFINNPSNMPAHNSGSIPTYQSPGSHLSSSTDQLARREITSSPAMSEIAQMRPSSAGNNSG